MYRTIAVKLILFLAVLLYLGCGDHDGHGDEHGSEGNLEGHECEFHGKKNDTAHGGHAAHDDDHKAHEKHGKEEKVSEHAGGDHGSHAEHEEHGIEVELTARGVALAEIGVDTVRMGNISKTLELPGEVGFNEDKVAHVVPRFSGIVTKAYKKLGDYVRAGETIASIESNESLSEYLVKARISGRVIEKHATLGEFVSTERPIYVIADLASVWVGLAVYAKDAPHVRVGQKVSIEAIGSQQKVSGKISYLSNIYNEHTRNMTARVVVPNHNNLWKPGTFVTGLVRLKSPVSVMTVSEQAIQTIDEKPCIFVPVKGEKNVFRPVEVTVGERDSRKAQILSGLGLGDLYVTSGAYELKSKIITSSLGDHAGHGH